MEGKKINLTGQPGQVETVNYTNCEIMMNSKNIENGRVTREKSS